MRKLIAFLFIFVLSGCYEPSRFYVINETKSKVELKLFFRKQDYIDIGVALPIRYENGYKDGLRSRLKIDYSRFTKSITLNPEEEIEINCGSQMNSIPEPMCSYIQMKAEQLEFIEYTHLGLNKKVRFNLQEFYKSRSFFFAEYYLYKGKSVSMNFSLYSSKVYLLLAKRIEASSKICIIGNALS